jgi:hypothetical protein
MMAAREGGWAKKGVVAAEWEGMLGSSIAGRVGDPAPFVVLFFFETLLPKLLIVYTLLPFEPRAAGANSRIRWFEATVLNRPFQFSYKWTKPVQMV